MPRSRRAGAFLLTTCQKLCMQTQEGRSRCWMSTTRPLTSSAWGPARSITDDSFSSCCQRFLLILQGAAGAGHPRRDVRAGGRAAEGIAPVTLHGCAAVHASPLSPVSLGHDAYSLACSKVQSPARAKNKSKTRPLFVTCHGTCRQAAGQAASNDPPPAERDLQPVRGNAGHDGTDDPGRTGRDQRRKR